MAFIFNVLYVCDCGHFSFSKAKDVYEDHAQIFAST